ncbi:hypothetical protein TNCV_4686511 [Trichonephila clavipes]|nr:hypothetical protein TNCV_4686511 [Trichonephila clavipes]
MIFSFKSGILLTEDMPRPERPSTRNEENISKIKRVLDKDRRKTIDKISKETNVGGSRVSTTLLEFCVGLEKDEFLPRLVCHAKAIRFPTPALRGGSSGFEPVTQEKQR